MYFKRGKAKPKGKKLLSIKGRQELLDYLDRESFVNEPIQVSTARHRKNYDAMVGFDRDLLGMSVKQSWDHPGNRGALLSFDGGVTGTVI